jgi:menaquinone-9 beta-reductase
MTQQAEVAIVGGGPAGAALSIRLADAGVDVVLFERWPAPRWRASGVYSSPLTRGRLASLGLDSGVLDVLIRPIDAMEVISPRGTRCRLEHGPSGHACGIDRVRLERALLDRAVAAGARIREGAVVRSVEPAGRAGRDATVQVSGVAGAPSEWRARLVVGADGPRSVVARAYRVSRAVRRLRRAGLTCHRLDPAAEAPGVAMTARMHIGDGWYMGVAPVPGGRVNLGLVLPESRLRRHAATGGAPERLIEVASATLSGPRHPWQDSDATDELTVALPLAHRVTRRAGPGYLLVGDAAGFIDPLSGEGLHRALASAELAAEAVERWRRGDRGALERFDERLRARFVAKDVFSWLLQLFLADTRVAEYALRRLAQREALRTTLAAVLSDERPATRALDPRFLGALLRP